MTMDLGGDAFFVSYLQALSNKQLEALSEWQRERLTGTTNKDIVTDAVEKKRLIYLERRRRDRSR